MTDRNALANALMGRSLLDEPPADMRQQIANALMQPSTADIRNTPAQRGEILPLAIYGDGSARPALPQWANRLWEIASLQRRPDASEGDALLIGGAPALGGMPFAQPNSVGSFGGRLASWWKDVTTNAPPAPKRMTVDEILAQRAARTEEQNNLISEARHNASSSTSLPMDEASRLARAQEMGFDTSKIYYHGTDQYFPAFRKGPDTNELSGTYIAGQRETAEGYGPVVREMYVRPGNHLRVDMDNWSVMDPADAAKIAAAGIDIKSADGGAMRRKLQGLGYDTVGYWVRPENKDLVEAWQVVLNAKDLRDTQAVFDPSKSSSNNLLAANPSTSAINALIAAALQNQQQE